MSNLKCTYCSEEAQSVTGETVYPHRPDLKKLSFWYCNNGHLPAYVGSHSKTGEPLGTLANAELRAARSQAHQAFDPLWRQRPAYGNRDAVYYSLRKYMGLSPEECHIGMFNLEQCAQVIAFAEEKTAYVNRTNEGRLTCKCCGGYLSSDFSNNAWCSNQECSLLNKVRADGREPEKLI